VLVSLGLEELVIVLYIEIFYVEFFEFLELKIVVF